MKSQGVITACNARMMVAERFRGNVYVGTRELRYSRTVSLLVMAFVVFVEKENLDRYS